MRIINLLATAISVCVYTFGLTACADSLQYNPHEERSKILELHHLERTYHLQKMAKELVALQSENFISINRGEIITPTKEEQVAMFTDYFSSVEFEAWDDINPPLIEFSDDYSLAYVVVNKRVVITYQDENGNTAKDSGEFAWVSIYRKQKDDWKLHLLASTNKPRES